MILRTLLFLILYIASVSAQGVSTGGTSLLLPISADQTSLADAGVALRATAGAASVNPAALAGVERPGLRFTHVQWMADVRTQALAAVLPTSSVVYTFGITNTSVPGIPVREIPGPATSEFTARAVSMRAGAAFGLADEVYAGITVKYLYERLFVDDATGGAVDLGILYDSPDLPFRLGASLTNLGSLSAFRSATNDLPTAFQVGAARSMELIGVTWTGVVSYMRETRVQADHIRAGLEATYASAVSARIGYASGYETRGLSYGLGVRYEFIELDYAYIPMSLDRADAHCITAGILF